MLTDTQKANRKKGIGGSEVAIVFGLNKYVSPYDLWMVKTGRKDADDISDQPPVKWGTIHEAAIADEYAKQMGVRVRRANETKFHKKYPHMLCHIDRKIEGQDKLLECKFACFHSDEWGEAGSDHVPLPYILQVQHQLAVTGYQEADLAVLISGFDFRVYHFKRDEEVISRIIEVVGDFWKGVESDTAPALRDRSDVLLAYPHSKDFYKVADSTIVETWERYHAVKEQADPLVKQQEELKDQLAIYMGEAEGLKNDIQVMATYKTGKRGRSMRIKGIRHE